MLSTMASQMWMKSIDHGSSTSTTDDNVHPSHLRWEKNYANIPWALDTSLGKAHSIVHNQLHYWKLCVCWVLKNLNDNHKAHCMGPLSQIGYVCHSNDPVSAEHSYIEPNMEQSPYTSSQKSINVLGIPTSSSKKFNTINKEDHSKGLLGQ